MDAVEGDATMEISVVSLAGKRDGEPRLGKDEGTSLFPLPGDD